MLAVASQSEKNQEHASKAAHAFGFAVTGVVGLTLSQQSVHAKDSETAAPQGEVDEYAKPTALKGLPKSITLYQYDVCPFCCKVKAVLDYHKLPYTVVEVNPLSKSELKWSTYKKVPVVKLDEEVVTGSSGIVSRLTAEVEAARKAGKAAPRPKGVAAGVSAEEELVWRQWVDERLVKIMTANIYRNWNEAWETFTYITEQTNWSWGTRELARWSGALIMWQVGKKMPVKYGIEGDLREALYKLCNEWVDAVGPSRPFLGGAAPNMADLSVFGVLRAIARTPAFNDMMTHSCIAPWYKRMEEAVGPSARVGTEGSSWGLTQKAAA